MVVISWIRRILFSPNMQYCRYCCEGVPNGKVCPICGLSFTDKTREALFVDLDNTLLDYDGWKGFEHFGTVRPSVVDFMQYACEKFWVVVYTTRVNPGVNGNVPTHVLRGYVAEFLKKSGIKYHAIAAGKPHFAHILDDKALPFDAKDPELSLTKLLLSLPE